MVKAEKEPMPKLAFKLYEKGKLFPNIDNYQLLSQ